MEKEKVLNKKKIIIAFAFLILFIILIALSVNSKKETGINAMILNDSTKLYSDPVEKSNKIIEEVLEYSEVTIIDSIIEDYKEWFLIRTSDNKKGYVLAENVTYFKKDKKSKVLVADFSSHNFKDVFKNKVDVEAFILNNNISYVYIRAGGRGYGKEGNFYTDEKYQVFRDACEYIGIEYGYYFLDEALNNKEIKEEIDFIDRFMKDNQSDLCTLPIALDVEDHEGKGRCADIWNDRAKLVSKLIKDLSSKGYNSILYTNANTCNTYLSSIDTEFWLAYYPEQNYIPDYWYNKTGQPATSNSRIMKRLVGWQFSENGVKHVISENIDLSLFTNNFFEE